MKFSRNASCYEHEEVLENLGKLSQGETSMALGIANTFSQVVTD